MKNLSLLLIALVSLVFETKAQKLGGPCEGCEAVWEYGNIELAAVDTLPDFGEKGKKIHIYGKVYKQDAKTPAPGIVLYIYHTDQEGIYPKKANAQGWGKRHGYLRTWLKTNDKGEYAFYTLRPASYPNRAEPAHIHITVGEPGKSAYYLDSFLFEDDPLLTPEKRKQEKNRGASGIVVLKKQDNLWLGKRDIILGRNIPNYR